MVVTLARMWHSPSNSTHDQITDTRTVLQENIGCYCCRVVAHIREQSYGYVMAPVTAPRTHTTQPASKRSRRGAAVMFFTILIWIKNAPAGRVLFLQRGQDADRDAIQVELLVRGCVQLSRLLAVQGTRGSSMSSRILVVSRVLRCSPEMVSLPIWS